MRGLQLMIALVAMSCVLPVQGNTTSDSWIDKLFKRNDKAQEVVEHPKLPELTVDENLAIPELDKKQKAKAVKLQAAEAERLKKSEGMSVELMRDNEVIHITIAASTLFAPNESTLLHSSDAILRSLLPCLRTPDYYHMLLVMHSDNTGNEEYNYALTTNRVSAIYDWFEINGGCVEYVVPYAAGSFEPLVANNTIAGRAKNRRLEIYLIPAEAMFKK